MSMSTVGAGTPFRRTLPPCILRSRPVLAWAMILMVTVAQRAYAQTGKTLYINKCAQCHGKDEKGGLAKSLLDKKWQFGDSKEKITKNIRDGIVDMGMPAYGKVMSVDEIGKLTDYILQAQGGGDADKAKNAPTVKTQDYKEITITTWIKGLKIPWGLTFIDAKTALITERPGGLRQIIEGKLGPPVKNTPQVLAQGQGGMLDVAVDPKYAENGWIYLSYSHGLPGKRRNPAMTRIVRGKIKENEWTDEQVIFEAPKATYRSTRHHYGCRLTFDAKGRLYFSIGDRGSSDHAQDLTKPNGKIHRIHADGKVPEDNPFVTTPDAIKSIYSYGNRNPQGLAIHPKTGALWSTEHGPMGGDEVNVIKSGANYGWPVITYGLNYNGTVISELTEKEGMEQPALFWRPSIAVCGIDFYTGKLFPKWRNHLLVTALKQQELRLLRIDGERVLHQEVLIKNMGRVRDVACGPDGAVYVVLNSPDVILRLTPSE